MSTYNNKGAPCAHDIMECISIPPLSHQGPFGKIKENNGVHLVKTVV
jgi:hypothetical protein